MSADGLSKMSRKQFLRGAAAGAADLAATSALVGCGGSEAGQPQEPASAPESSAPTAAH